MRRFPLLLSLTVAACGQPDPDTVNGDDTADTTDTDSGSDSDTDTGGDTEPDPGPANAQAEGTWELVAAGTTCNMSFAGTWTGVASTSDAYSFTLNYSAEARQLDCVIRATDTTKFTCASVAQSGQISSCNVTMSITDVGGSIADGAAELAATAQMTSSNCGSALNCGPLGHLAVGTIE